MSYKLKNNSKGFTLIELLLVTSIIGVLAVALTFTFQGWTRGYNAESQIKQIHIDLMNSRAMAMQTNRMHFMDLAATQYTAYDDTDTAPDGNGIANPATDNVIYQRNLDTRYPVTWNSDNRVEFSAKGLSTDTMTICSNSDAIADYDCINISPTRIKTGKLTTLITDGGACDAANCVER